MYKWRRWQTKAQTRGRRLSSLYETRKRRQMKTKRRRTQISQCWPLRAAKRLWRIQRKQQQQKTEQRQDGERKQWFEQQKEKQQQQNDKRQQRSAAILLKRKQKSERIKENYTTFIVLQKSMTSIHSCERIEEMFCELEGYRWDVQYYWTRLGGQPSDTTQTHIHGSRKNTTTNTELESCWIRGGDKKSLTANTSTNQPSQQRFW